jgi:HAE1 family hydrophobic/amphiphilic exporter-1
VKIADVSIRRPVFAAMLTLGLVVLGVVSVGRLELKLDPDIDFPFAVVVTELRGASPETVEREVTDILEERLNAIEGVRNLSSTSSQGLSRVFLEFGLQYEIDTKVQEVRDKVALARPLLPIDVEDPVVQKFDLGAIGFMTIVLGGPISRRDLSDFAENEVKERLERIGGVGGVNVIGAREREIRIWLDPLRLTGYGLSIEDVANTLRRENAELASGRIEGAEREWTVTTQGKARSVEEFGEIIVAERQGRTIQLRDVAVVEDGMEDEKSVARFDGEPGVALEIQQQSGSDVVAAARAIRAELELIREQAPAGVSVIVARDYAQIIEQQVYAVFYDMLLAGALVVGVVLCFLRNYRSTFIAGLAIPASVIASFAFLYLFDLSLNNMTLMALSLAIGLVIDDAIVVLESIFRWASRSSPPRSPCAASSCRSASWRARWAATSSSSASRSPWPSRSRRSWRSRSCRCSRAGSCRRTRRRARSSACSSARSWGWRRATGACSAARSATASRPAWSLS